MQNDSTQTGLTGMTDPATPGDAPLPADPTPGDGFWVWSNTVYLRPVVADTCLNIQDEFDADVNMLLWSCWAAVAGYEPLEHAHFAEAIAETAPIARDVTKPLRAARHAVKALADYTNHEERRSVRTKILDAELDLERFEQRVLGRFLETRGTRTDETGTPKDPERRRRVARANLATYFQALGRDPEEPQVGQRVAGLLASIFTP